MLSLDEMVDHQIHGWAVVKDDHWHQQAMQSEDHTVRWKSLVKWKDGSSSCAPLKDLKESYPIEVVEHAIVNEIAKKPAFA